ncbi:hypothetical protein CPB84DRAFT_1857949 [Gymnopilus junonius]|uniref:Uncharacterized protein n=1 Tax=Gymnopilus junonius TaxID=109634 RepID=A0A9P5N729_GYMJU|nr:hypothetical protein CPB84DRAFT_1857949 [Gymnopilus junonius]
MELYHLIKICRHHVCLFDLKDALPPANSGQRFQSPFTVPVHKVPNLCLAKWNVHHIIRIFFPALYSEERKPHLSQDEQRKFYEFGLRPAIQRIDPAQMAEWPVMYDDKMFCARGQSRTFSMQTKVTIDWMSQYLGEYIRDALESNGLDWGMGLVFLHQIRGIKNATTHSHTDAAAEESLVKFLKKNLLISPEADGYDELLQSGKWWIDVGVEVASDQE